MPETRYFLCTGDLVPYKDLYKHPKAHIIGHVQYVTLEKNRVTALALWRESVPANVVPPLSPKIIGYVVGDMIGIACTFGDCKRKQRWEIGRAGFLTMIERYGGVERLKELDKTTAMIKSEI